MRYKIWIEYLLPQVLGTLDDGTEIEGYPPEEIIAEVAYEGIATQIARFLQRGDDSVFYFVVDSLTEEQVWPQEEKVPEECETGDDEIPF